MLLAARTYAAALISDRRVLDFPAIFNANGIVVNAPTAIRAHPVAFRACLSRSLEANIPIPAPRAIRVPAKIMISSKEKLRSIIRLLVGILYSARLDARVQAGGNARRKFRAKVLGAYG